MLSPLQDGGSRMTWRDIGDRLEQMSSAPRERNELAVSAGGERWSDLFTARGANVGNVFRGKTVPSRDVLIDLLQLVQEECGALSREVVQELWELYREALLEKSPATYARYVFQDAYAAAVVVAQFQQQKVADLQEKLHQGQELTERAQQRVQRLRLSQAVLHRSLEVAQEDVDRSQQRERLLKQSAAQLSVTVAGLERKVAEARTKLEHWQEQAEWQANLREQAERDAVLDAEAWAEREALLLERLAQAYETLETAAVQAQDVEAVLLARAAQWQQRARTAQGQARAARSDMRAAQQEAAAAQAETEAVREEAAAVREQAARAMSEQRAEFEAVTARAEDRYERAVQTAESLEEQLAQAKSQLEESRREAARADATLSKFLTEQSLNEALNDIVDQGIIEYGKIGSLEVAGFDVPPASNQTPSSQQPAFATTPVAGAADTSASNHPAPHPGQPSLPPQQRREGPDEHPGHETALPTQPPTNSRLTRPEKRQVKAWGLRDGRPFRRPRRYKRHRISTAPRAIAVRAIALLLGLTACAFGVLQVINGHKAQFPDQYAPPCSTASAQKTQADCISQETGRVESRTRDDSTARLTVTRNTGTSKTVTVDDPVYEAAHAGSPAKLTLWKDRIIEIGVAGKSSRVSSGTLWSPLLWATLLIGLGSTTIGLALRAGEQTMWGALWVLVPFNLFCTGFAATAVIALPQWWVVLIALPIWLLFVAVTLDP
ncbi:hypothetical protein [Streptomyces sp. NPDC058294]|uniref:hypothetical protein n=1 Tax=Streptomyces sp. NPDC058294 TaxID=3346430 RepID=UPI0036E3C8BE